MRLMLFVEIDYVYEPCGNLYADISKETFKFARILLASSTCMGGPAPIFSSPWIFEFMLHGGASFRESLPKAIAGDSVTRKFYNQVSFFGMVCKKKQLFISCKTILDFIAYRKARQIYFSLPKED